MIIWLASYPRSGNTYFRSILNHYFGKHSYSLYGDSRDIGANIELSKIVGHKAGNQQTLDFDKLRMSDEIFFIKTHDLPNETYSKEDVIFYIVRDGRDASASYLKYLHKVADLKATTLQDVLTGEAPFGFWGNHVLQWYQAHFDKVHMFKFEEITMDPEAFADQLSALLGSERSREPFPDFERFQEVAPSFFGKGKSGSYGDLYSGTHRALFELYSGPAMPLAGYTADGLNDDRVAAYAAFCQQFTALIKLRRAMMALKVDHATLKRERKTLASEGEELRKELTKQHDMLARVTDRYNRLLKCTGLGAIRWMVAKSREFSKQSED